MDKSQKRIGTRPLALQDCFVFDVVRSASEIEDVSQNCFVLDVVKVKKYGRLAELSNSNIEEVSQNNFVFKPADRQIDR